MIYVAHDFFGGKRTRKNPGLMVLSLSIMMTILLNQLILFCRSVAVPCFLSFLGQPGLLAVWGVVALSPLLPFLEVETASNNSNSKDGRNDRRHRNSYTNLRTFLCIIVLSTWIPVCAS